MNRRTRTTMRHSLVILALLLGLLLAGTGLLGSGDTAWADGGPTPTPTLAQGAGGGGDPNGG